MPLLTTGAGSYAAISGGGGGDTAQALAFIARTSPTLTGSDATNYKALINGLVNTNSTISGTLFSRFDMLCILAAPDSANALLSLINSTFASSNVGAAFTAYRGFAGNGSTTGVTCNFNPFTATTPKFQLNDAHFSSWNLTNATDNTAMTDQGTTSNLYPEFSDTNTYIRVNDNAAGFSTADARGHVLGNRDSGTTRQGYRNAASIGSYGTVNSTSVDNAVFEPIRGGSSGQNAMFSAGANLSPTDVTNFYNLLRTYMTAVGVP